MESARQSVVVYSVVDCAGRRVLLSLLSLCVSCDFLSVDTNWIKCYRLACIYILDIHLTNELLSVRYSFALIRFCLNRDVEGRALSSCRSPQLMTTSRTATSRTRARL
jgi:hypothetical protein